MFNLKDFVRANLISGTQNGVFAKEYTAILATNYLVKGILTEDDVAEIAEAITPIVEEENEVIEDE